MNKSQIFVTAILGLLGACVGQFPETDDDTGGGSAQATGDDRQLTCTTEIPAAVEAFNGRYNRLGAGLGASASSEALDRRVAAMMELYSDALTWDVNGQQGQGAAGVVMARENYRTLLGGGGAVCHTVTCVETSSGEVTAVQGLAKFRGSADGPEGAAGYRLAVATVNGQLIITADSSPWGPAVTTAQVNCPL